MLAIVPSTPSTAIGLRSLRFTTAPTLPDRPARLSSGLTNPPRRHAQDGDDRAAAGGRRGLYFGDGSTNDPMATGGRG